MKFGLLAVVVCLAAFGSCASAPGINSKVGVSALSDPRLQSGRQRVKNSRPDANRVSMRCRDRSYTKFDSIKMGRQGSPEYRKGITG